MLQRLLEGTGRSLQDLSENMFKNTVELGEVLFCLSTLKVEEKESWTISEIEVLIEKHLRTHEYEKIKRQYEVSNQLHLTINVDMDTELGIFCCEIKALTNSKIAATLGKIQLLQHLAYQEKLIVVVVGKRRYEEKANVQLLKSILETQETAFLFLPID